MASIIRDNTATLCRELWVKGELVQVWSKEKLRYATPIWMVGQDLPDFTPGLVKLLTTEDEEWPLN